MTEGKGLAWEEVGPRWKQEVEEAQGELERSGTKVDKFNSLTFFPTNLKSSEKQQIVAEINEESFTSKSIIKTLY